MQKGGIPTRFKGQGQGIKTGLCVSKDGKCPKATDEIIDVSFEAASKVIALLRVVKKEFIVALYGHDDDDGIRVMEVTCPPQYASATECEIKTGEFPPEKLNGYDFLGLAHSHAGMTTFWSGTDDKAITNYRVNIEVNEKLDVKAAVRKKLECGALMLVKAQVRLIVDNVWAEEAFKTFIDTSPPVVTGTTGMKWESEKSPPLPKSIVLTLATGKTLSIDREGTTTSPNGIYTLEDNTEVVVAAGHVNVEEPLTFVLRNNKQEVVLTNDGLKSPEDVDDEEDADANDVRYMPMTEMMLNDLYGYGVNFQPEALNKENTDDETWLQRCEDVAEERRKKHAKHCDELNSKAE